jgi:hypothetical protein
MIARQAGKTFRLRPILPGNICPARPAAAGI